MTSDTAVNALTKAQEADAKASLALSKQDDHEKVCAERYQGIRDDSRELRGDIKAVAKSIAEMKSRDSRLALALIGLLLAVIGFLLQDKFFP